MIRPALHSELGYCLATWKISSQRGKRMMSVARDAATATIRSLLETQRVLARVQPGIVPDERHQDVIGWVCFLPTRSTAVLHYVYVRAPYRRMGIARALVRAAGADTEKTVFFTSQTALGDAAVASSSIRGKYIRLDEVL